MESKYSKITLLISAAALLMWLFVFKNTQGVSALTYSIIITTTPYIVYILANIVINYKKIVTLFTALTFIVSTTLLFIWEINGFTIVTISTIQGVLLLLSLFIILIEKNRYKN